MFQISHNKQKRFQFLFTIYLSALLLLPSANAKNKSDDPKTIIKKADEIRFPQKDFSMKVRITTKEPGQSNDEHIFKVLSSGIENSLVITLTPDSERGQMLLMKDTDLWSYMPQVSQPIRLSLNQKLTGIVANGDIARTNFAEDYNATLDKVEKIDKTEYYVLTLIKKNQFVTYQKVRYWVEKKTYRPFKAEFYSVSDRVLKYCTFEKYKKTLGVMRPSRMVLTDATKKDFTSVIDYTAMKLLKIPAKYFAKEHLKKIDANNLEF